MTVTVREVTWGDELVVATFHTEGGLLNAVRRIHAAVGDEIGLNNAFKALFFATDPAELNERQQRRAWLLLTAYGLDPADWGITDDVLPLAWNISAVREQISLDPAARCYIPANERESDGADDEIRTRNILLGRQRL